MRKIPIIMDCDPGHDDALAMLWALSEPEKLEIKAVTIVAGNQTLEKTTRNALRVLTFAGVHNIPVAMGADHPLMRPSIFEEGVTEMVHGQSGLDGPAMPEPGFAPEKMSALQLLIKTIEESEEKITLVPTGPLTNIAALFLVRPDLKEKIERISLMGGGAYTGNWTPAAEYNIYVDPEAASIVFNSGVPIVMAGLDVTHQAYITREENEILRQKGGRIAVFAAELIDFFSRYHYEVEKLPGCTIHDACAVAYLCHPEIFVEKQCHVDIELEGSLTAGTTVCDPGNYEGKEKNATVLYGVDREKFAELFIEAMSKLDK
ncbi:MAG TPA: nucleoside hydrolase [Firmicutes bacterium]|nr:nucleoside hydrolase [Clostridiales bacterium]HIY81364.1 nucleoside hydrolase [Bacillota bacterium]